MNKDRILVQPRGGVSLFGLIEIQRSKTVRGMVMAALVALSFLPLAAQAQFECTTNNGTITITGYTGDGGAVPIPSTLNGRAVTAIRTYAFYNKANINSISVPSSVTVIGSGAFSGCSNLYSITVETLNKNYSSVDGVLFDKNKVKLLQCPAGRAGKYTVPSSVATIDDWAFYNSVSLEEVSIPNSVITIGDKVFYGCTGLTSLKIPNSVTSIGDAAFSGCASLAGIDLPDSVTSLGDGAFSDCSSLTAIELPTSIASVGNDAFSGCTSLSGIVMPNNITSIGSYAFFGCTSLTNITIPNSVLSIGPEAFYACTGLTSVTIPIKVVSVRDNTFYGCTSLNSVSIPLSVTSIGDNAFSGCVSLPSIAIPNKVTRIGNYAFYACSNLTSISLSNSITSIGAGAFAGCSSLNGINVPTRLTSIGANTFSDCISLTSILLPLRITSIGNYAFSGCTALTNITMHSRVRTIGNNAFTGCTAFTNMALPTGVRTIGGDAFSGCTNLSKITFSSSLASIENNLFAGCVSLTNITIPSTARSIGDSAFSGCIGLTRITVPSSVRSIGNSAFFGCSGLTNISIPSTVSSIGEYAFSGCTGLAAITLPTSLTSIADYAFSGCTRLAAITIPSRVTRIGNYSFADCLSLASVTMYSRVASIGVGAFAGCASLVNIALPASMASVGSEAFSGCPALKFVFFQGNVPPSVDIGLFEGSTNATVYYPTGKTGWGDSLGGAPVVRLTAPLIAQAPTNQLVLPGTKVSFRVIAYGPTPISYHWRLNGANIAGAMSSSYTLTSAQPRNAGSYTVVVANSHGSVTSSPAILSFKPTATGDYRGLIVAADPFDSANTGAFSATLTAGGGFSAKLTFQTQTVTAAGKIDPYDNTNFANFRFAAKIGGRDVNVSVRIALDSSAALTGLITPVGAGSPVARLDGAMVADLNMGQFNVAVLPGATAPASGNGYGSVAAASTGVKLNLALADDKAVITAYSTDRLKNGLIPVFVPLYGNKGFLSGWLSATNQQIVSQSPVVWHKDPGASTNFFVNGFNQQVVLQGGIYTATTNLSAWGNAGLIVDDQPVQNGHVDYASATISKGILSIPVSDGQTGLSTWSLNSASGAVTLSGAGLSGNGVLVPSTAPAPGVYGFTTQTVNGTGEVHSVYSGPSVP